MSGLRLHNSGLADKLQAVLPNGNNNQIVGQFLSHIPVRYFIVIFGLKCAILFPYGNLPERCPTMKVTPQQIGTLIRTTRKNLGVTQKDLALTSGTGLRFIIDLEKGKETCEIGKAMTVLHTLGIKVALTPPPTKGE